MRLLPKEDFIEAVNKAERVVVWVSYDLENNDGVVEITKVAARKFAEGKERINVTTSHGTLYIGNGGR